MDFTIDLRRVKTQRQLHNRLKKQLCLPSYYGRNLDALNDILTEPCEKRRLVFVNWQPASEALGTYFDSLKALLEELAQKGVLQVVWS